MRPRTQLRDGSQILLLLKAAGARAQRGGKNVLVVFHASWCGRCKRMEKYLADPEVRPRIDASYEVVWLDALERPAMTRIENPGASALLTTWGGGSDLRGRPSWRERTRSSGGRPRS